MTVTILAQIVFWLSLAAIAYAYVGYPLLIYALSRINAKPVHLGKFEPVASVIITAYNEEKNIRLKIENTLSITYPKDKLQIIVASDGSTDETDNIVREFAHRGVTLFRQEGRVGKTVTQNAAVERAVGDIILFSDATTMYRPDVLVALLPNFSDPSVGCVAGKLLYENLEDSSVGEGAKGYWSYERFLKENESRACSLIGVSGCLYGVRRSAYVPMYPEACSDFLICTIMYRQGLRSVYEPKAVCVEETNHRAVEEFQMRVRIIAQTLTDLWRNRDMLNPFRGGIFSIQLLSHKVLRYLVPVFLVCMLISSGLLGYDSVFFAAVFILQVAFYLATLLIWVLESRDLKLGVLAFPLYFVLANLASGIGYYRFLRGERYASWEPNR